MGKRIKMLSSQGACNDGINVNRYQKDQIIKVPEELTIENAKIFIKAGFAIKLEEEIKPEENKVIKPEEIKGNNEEEIIDIEDEEEPPETVKELQNKNLFNKNKWKKNKE